MLILNQSDYKPQSVISAPGERCGHSWRHDGVGGLHTGSGQHAGGGLGGGAEGGGEGRVHHVVTSGEQDHAPPGPGTRHVSDQRRVLGLHVRGSVQSEYLAASYVAS